MLKSALNICIFCVFKVALYQCICSTKLTSLKSHVVDRVFGFGSAVEKNQEEMCREREQGPLPLASLLYSIIFLFFCIALFMFHVCLPHQC